MTWKNTCDSIRVKIGNKIVCAGRTHINKSIYTKSWQDTDKMLNWLGEVTSEIVLPTFTSSKKDIYYLPQRENILTSPNTTLTGFRT